MSLVLSLFPGIGLLDLAFEQEWPDACIVKGPDPIFNSLSDVRTFHPPAGKFDGVIGGPPCQSFSSLVHLVRANGCEPRFGNLIPEFERCVHEAEPGWFVMENVPQAPEPIVAGYGTKSFLLDNSMLAGDGGFGLEQRRVRRFTFGMRGRTDVPSLMRWIDLAVFLLPDATGTCTQWTPDNRREAKVRQPAVTSTDGGERPSEKRRCAAVLGDSRETPVAIGGSGKVKRTQHDALVGGHGMPPSARDKVRVQAVSGSNGGAGAQRNHASARNSGKGRYRLADAIRLQGLPDGFLDDSPFTADGKLKAIANGVPIPMGRAIAKAVKEAIQCP